MNTNTIFIIVIVVIAVLGLFVIPRILVKRAVNQVISILRQHNATSAKTAKTVDELKLAPRSFFEGMLKVRDYKPFALDMLQKANIVRLTEDGKLYLSEETLATSKLSKWQTKASQYNPTTSTTQKDLKRPRFPF